MNSYILDLEGNGLREDITEIHCICCKSISSNKMYRFYNKNKSTNDINNKEFDYDLKIFKRFLHTCGTLITHNGIGYDIPVLSEFYKHDMTNINVIDTYVISNLLNPDRQLPEGCPTSTPNPLTGNQDKIGPHSLEAHGFRLGYQKIHHHDWRNFSDEMLSRCESDVLITEALYYDFMFQIGRKL